MRHPRFAAAAAVFTITTIIISITFGRSILDARADDRVGAVFTATNALAGNQVLMWTRSAEGRLTFVGGFATGGTGSGDGLGNQGGVRITSDGKFVVVVNAGSNQISTLEIDHDGLLMRDVAPSGGVRPVSVAVNGRLVYVLNAGGAPDSVVGFRLARDGQLTMIPGSTRLLSAASTGAAQVEFSPDGGSLVVSEKATNRIDVFAVGDDGALSARTTYAAPGQTPFGFAFGHRDQLFVSEAFGGALNGSAVSSYQLTSDSTLGVVSPSVPTTETAACWVTVSGDGRFAYTTNAGSGSISGYAIRPDGTISLLDPDGVTVSTGAGPSDLALSHNDQFVYVLHSGAGRISGYRVQEHGGLIASGSVLLPGGANGIAIR